MQRARSIGEIRQAWGPDWSDASDEEVLEAYSRATGVSLAEIAGAMGYDPGRGSMNRERMSASIDSYQSNLYGVAEEALRAVGANSPADFFARQRRRNQVQAQIAAERARNLGAIDSFTEVNSLGDFGNYVAGLGIQSLPYMGEALAGGLVARGAMVGTRAALDVGRELGIGAAQRGAAAALNRGSVAGAVAASYPSAVGDILQNQRDQAGTTDFQSALVGGAPYAALNAFGVEGALARGALFRNAVGALDNLTGARGAAARMAATGVATGVKEGVSEVGQEAANQYFGRMAVDPSETFWNPESQGRFAESFVGGGLLGGTVSAVGGGWRRSEGYRADVDLTQPEVDLLQGGDASRPPFTLEAPVEFTGPPAPDVAAPVVESLQNPNQIEMFMPGGEPTYNADPSFGFGFSADPVESAPRDPRVLPAPLERAPAAPGSEIPAVGLDGPQQDLFTLREAPLNQFSPLVQPEFNVEDGPAVDPRQLDMFAERPTAMVRTDFAPHQLVRELRQANEGKTDPYVMKLAAGLSKVLGDAPKTEAFLADEQDKLFSSRASPATTARRQRVLDAAMDVADRYRQRMMDAMAQEGVARARPGVRVGAEPQSNVTELTMRERNRREAIRAATAEVDARVQATRDAQVTATRRRILDDILGDEKTVNPLGRFTAELKRRNLPNIGVTAEEMARIKRFEDARAAFTAPAPETQPDAAAKYDGVSVSFKVEAAGKTRTMIVKDAGKKIRELDAKVSKYEQLLRCLTE